MQITEVLFAIFLVAFVVINFLNIDWRDSKTYKVSFITLATIAVGVLVLSHFLA
jgi:hypothetical protein